MMQFRTAACPTPPHSAPPAVRGVHGVVARARRRGGVPFEISVGGSEGHGDGSLEALRSTVKYLVGWVPKYLKIEIASIDFERFHRF